MRRSFCFAFAAMSLLAACSKGESTPNSAPVTPEPSAGTPVAAPSAAGTQANANSVRGRLVSASDTSLTVGTRSGGDVTVKIAQPLEVYSRVPAKISDVKENSFVGITSVPQADGTLRATEIHIFPENLRGTNEGSFLMGQGPGGGGDRAAGPNRMTNGTVAAPSGNRMTNGTVGAQSGNHLTVKFQSDSQTIAVPPNVSVTALALTKTKLVPGMNVVVQTTRAADGTLSTSRVFLSPPRAASRS